MSYTVVYTDRFNACVADYSTQDARYLAELMEVVTELARRPFNNPKLQTHAMKGVKGEKRFISYVGGSKGRRLIWSRFNRALVLLLYGEHDVEEQAERLEITYDGDDRGVTIIETSQAGNAAPAASAAEGDDDPGQLFMAWTDQELRAFGFAEHEVPVLRRLDSEDELIELNMSDESFELAYNLLAHQDPLGPAAAKVSPDTQLQVEAQTRELRADEYELEEAIAAPEARKHFLPVSDEELRALLSAPVEDWMVFLHPDQSKLAERPFSGPARVRGAAGTGKTVVGLHRARTLAKRHGGRVLFTTFVTNLPPVFASLYQRLSPETANQVDFLNLHKVAHRLVRDAGEDVPLNPDAAASAFADAWAHTQKQRRELEDMGLTRAYLRQEIDWIMKGRGLTSVEQYLTLPRTGRGTPLGEAARREAWTLYEEYQRRLEHLEVIDFADLLNRAIELLILGRVQSPYRSVIVDEAQDLTEMGLRLAYLLAGSEQPDGLLIVGDGQQSVYPGGFSLGQLGIDVRGRSTVLRVNYRNPRTVSELAQALVAGTSFDDLDDEATTDDDLTLAREGGDVETLEFTTTDEHDLALVARIAELADRTDTGPGDIAVLVPTNRMVKHYDSLIADLGLRTQRLEKYEGVPNDCVKIGTYQRGKGLEFKRVMVPRLDAEGVDEEPRHGEDDATHAERLELLRRQVFVAITRARDGVWLGWVDEPAELFGALRQSTLA